MPSTVIPLPDFAILESNSQGREFLCIRHPSVSARISLTGAHLVSCQPTGQADLLWFSPEDEELPDTALRGGIPICWPWFGNDRPDAPAHGIARTARWELRSVEQRSDHVRIIMVLPEEIIARVLPDESWAVQVTFELCQELKVSLTSCNTGTIAQPLSQALHTYLPVLDIDRVELSGLMGVRFFDKLTGEDQSGKDEALKADGELDRIYHGYTGPVTLYCPGMPDRIITREGSSSLVVWNPGHEKSKTLSQFPADGYRRMICVEAANAGQDKRLLAPGEVHTLATRLRREKALHDV
ncbi:D-hexose-6-phosphate mutarotase [Nitrincola alkalilacustris]|uniref:D-hexose-6-phosphate mutarotase n=1 Tax=Nitrincola alkalilacustris TaxID=1571224 RepID=UPI001456D868|nr:D-hexose-6-phosphate mutarotase [Nitrincola alkalilacustris]